MCVTRRAHKERRIVSKQRIRKDTVERVRRQGKKKKIQGEGVSQKKKCCITAMKEVMRSVTEDEGSTGAEEERRKRVID